MFCRASWWAQCQSPGLRWPQGLQGPFLGSAGHAMPSLQPGAGCGPRARSGTSLPVPPPGIGTSTSPNPWSTEPPTPALFQTSLARTGGCSDPGTSLQEGGSHMAAEARPVPRGHQVLVAPTQQGLPGSIRLWGWTWAVVSTGALAGACPRPGVQWNGHWPACPACSGHQEPGSFPGPPFHTLRQKIRTPRDAVGCRVACAP